MFSLLDLTENISPLELTFLWLFNRLSNHPLPDLCIDKIAKNLTGLRAHSALEIDQNRDLTKLKMLLSKETKTNKAENAQIQIWKVQILNYLLKVSGIG